MLLKATISSSSLRFLSRANRHTSAVICTYSRLVAFISYIVPRRLWLSTVLLKVTSSSYISHFASCLSHTPYGFVQLRNTPHILRTHCHTFAVTRSTSRGHSHPYSVNTPPFYIVFLAFLSLWLSTVLLKVTILSPSSRSCHAIRNASAVTPPLSRTRIRVITIRTIRFSIRITS